MLQTNQSIIHSINGTISRAFPDSNAFARAYHNDDNELVIEISGYFKTADFMSLFCAGAMTTDFNLNEFHWLKDLLNEGEKHYYFLTKVGGQTTIVSDHSGNYNKLCRRFYAYCDQYLKTMAKFFECYVEQNA